MGDPKGLQRGASSGGKKPSGGEGESADSAKVPAMIIGGALIGNLIAPGIGGAIVGGLVGGIVGSQSSGKKGKK